MALRRLGIYSAFSRYLRFTYARQTKFNPLCVFLHNSKIRLDQRTLEVKMPSLSPTMTEGTIVKWLKKEGDSISPGDVLCEIQTDKAIVGFEVEEEGVLEKILIPEDSKNIKLGEVIALIAIEGDFEMSNNKINHDVKADSVMEKLSLVTVSEEKSMKLCGPSVRKLLHTYGIEYSLVTPTGPHNNLLKGDVLSYIKTQNIKLQKQSPTQLPKTPDVTFIETENYIDIPHTSMRKTIAKRLTESKTTIPHAYMSIDCKMDNILEYRKKFKIDDINVSVNDFVIKSAAVALTKVPEVNVNQFNNQSKREKSINISVAVATENGLITPIVKNADNLSIFEISQNMKELAAKAREGTLKPEEFIGGSFSVTNLGMFGICEFSAIINPPQGAILAIGTSRIVLDDDKPVTKMKVTLSFNETIIDDNSAGKFLQYFKECIEDPFTMLV